MEPARDVSHGEIGQLAIEMDKKAVQLQEHAFQLQEALSPILRKVPTDSETMKSPESMTDFGGFIQSVIYSIELTDRVIGEIRNRLEL